MKPRILPTARLSFPLASAIAALLAALLAPHAAHAASANWTGAGGDALWSNVSNWSASPVPGTGNTATFNAAAGAGGTVIDLGAGVTVDTISFVGPSFAAYTIGAGGANTQTLTLNGSGNAGLASSGTATTAQITINAAITVNNTQQWVLNQGANPWIVNGNVSPNGAAGSIRQVKINGHKCTFNGILADQVGGAKLQMAGANAQTATLTNPNNSFTGGLVFDNGTVSVNSIDLNGVNSAAGAGGILQFGTGFGGGTLVYTGTGNTTDRVVNFNTGFFGPTITQSGAGLLKFTADLTATAVGSQTLTLNGSTAGTGEIAGTIVDNGTAGFTPLKTAVPATPVTSLVLFSVDGITVGAAVSGSASIPGGTTVTAINASTRTITLSAATTGTIAQNANITVSGLVNIAHLTKSGSGTWTLSAANTHSGFTKISGGTLTLANSLALQNSPIDMVGSIAGTTTAGLKTTATTLTLGGLNGTASPKNLASIFTTTAGGYGAVTDLTLNPRAGASFSYSGVIANGATDMTLIKTGTGTQILGGANTYSGATTINAGTLALGAINVLPDTAVNLGAGTLNAATFTDTLGTLDVTGAATINLGSGGALAFADSNAVDWTGGILKITGTFVPGDGSSGSIRFGDGTGTGLTPAQLALILGPGYKDFTLDTGGFLTGTPDGTAPTLAGITDDKSGGPIDEGTVVTFTVSFSEDMDASTVTAADFGNAGTAAITIGSVTETSPGVFSVQVTPTTAGTLQLKINQSAVLADVAANLVDTTSAIPGGANLTVNDATPPTLTSIVDNKSGGPVIPNTVVTYTVTFNEDMDESTVDITDFGNAVAVLDGGAAITIDSVTETAPGVFTVVVTPTSVGPLRLQVNQSAVLTDTSANALNTSSAIPDDTTLTVLAISAYWDRNSTELGAGTTPTGNWDATANWNTATDGTGSTYPWAAGQTAVFAAGTDASGTYNVTVSGTQDISGLTFEEGTVTLAGGTALRLVANSVVDVAAGLTASVTTTITNDVARSLTKTGDGTLSLFNTNNTFGGGTIVNAGTIKVDGLTNGNNPVGALGGGNVTVNNGGIISVGAFNSLVGYNGSTSQTTTINSGGLITNPSTTTPTGCHLNKLVMAGGVLNATAAEPLYGSWVFDQTVSTPGTGSSSLISGGNASLTQAGGSVFNIGENDTLTITTQLARTTNVGDTGLTKSGAGTLILGSANTYRSATKITAGTLSLSNSLALQYSVLDTAGSTLGDATNGLKTTVTALTLGGLTGDKDLASVFITPGGGYDTVTGLTLSPWTGVTNSYSGIIADGLPTGMTLAKTGAGTQTLTGANSYTGATTISDGTLLVNSPGSLHASSAVAVNAGTLGGDGTIGGSVTVATGGSLAPGASAAGTLTIGGNLDVSAMAAGTTGKLKFELAALAATSDKIAVTGTLTIGSGVLGFGDFVFTNAGAQIGTYKLITGAGGLTGTLDSANLSGTLGSGLVGTLQITGTDVELVVITAYDAWANAKGLDGSNNAKDADPDGDGKNNLSEFAFDGNPLSGANDGKIVGKVATVNAAQVLTLTLPVRTGATFSASFGDQLSALIDGIYYRIEGDVNLSTFADAVAEVPAGADLTAIQAGLPTLSTGWTYRTFRAPGTVPTVPKAFLRAKISE